MQPVSSRKNVQYKKGRRLRLPDVPGLAFEKRWWAEGAVVAGIDEVGRGAWAGPVTYAAVILPTDRRMYKDRKSTRLNSSHANISYAVFCLKKKKQRTTIENRPV